MPSAIEKRNFLFIVHQINIFYRSPCKLAIAFVDNKAVRQAGPHREQGVVQRRWPGTARQGDERSRGEEHAAAGWRKGRPAMLADHRAMIRRSKKRNRQG